MLARVNAKTLWGLSLALLVIGGGVLEARRAKRAPEPQSAEVESRRRATTGPLPGTEPFPAEVAHALERAWKERRHDYQPRTKHLREEGGPKFTNRLFLETSPYLRQHAHNPVNWFPWGEEAFERARQLGRPILLSVGYSTCHWCHVMEEESFEDVEIAEYLNRHYVAIKVDREERPDIDSIYMTAVRMLTGRGGWPMTVWLTPDKTPFEGGTYFPARDGDRGQRLGFLTLLRNMAEQFEAQPGQIVESAAKLAINLQRSLESSRAGGLPDVSALLAASTFYDSRFDDERGGLARAPKFPSSLPIRFLLRQHRRTGDARALRMATLTLEQMAAGGIYDHVGGGFHRYSTDADWLVPHFEKMLYDNALLALAYLEGYQATGNGRFAQVAREVLRYVSREMTAPGGAFYSATDADSLTPDGQREEGWFFTWTPQELHTVLGEELAKVARATFAVTGRGNFEGRNILHTPRPLATVANELGIDVPALNHHLQTIRDELYAARSQRPTPLRDEKILTAWNGLMISAFARASLVFGDAEYRTRAAAAATFLLAHRRRGGRLQRSIEDEQSRHEAQVDDDADVTDDAYLDDYAFLIAGLLDLYEASHELAWLQAALELNQLLDEHYVDRAGGYFLTSDEHEALLAREKPAQDGAEPSGNSVQLLNLLRLYELTTEERFRQRAEATLRAFGRQLSNSPSSLSEMLLAVDFYLDRPKQIAIVTQSSPDADETLLRELRSHFVPNRVLSTVSEGPMLEAQQTLVPMLEHKVARGGKPTAYVCERGVCELPTTDPAVFARQLLKSSAKKSATPGDAPR